MQEQADGSSQDVKGADSGTHLSATASAGEPVCLPDGEAEVAITGILTSTASAAWADVTLSIDGGAPYSIDEVLPTDFSHDGRTKTYDYTYDVDLADGSHDVTICFIQPSGHARMTACATVHVVVACEQSTPSACHQEGPFGETIGNRNLCHGGHDPNLEIQAKGDFGDSATLTVSGPGGFGFTTGIPHSGQSCVYHYNWVTDGNNGGTGPYTFTVAGNGNEVSWTETVFCL